MTWSIEPAREVFPRHRAAWDAINRAADDHILLDSDFVEPLVEAFAGPELLLARTSGMMVLLEPAGQGLWRTFAPSQAPIGLLVVRSGDALAAHLQGLLRALPGLAIGVDVLKQDTGLAHFGQLPRSSVYEAHYIDTPHLKLAGDFESYWSKRGSDLKEGMAKRRRRLQRDGIEFRLERVRDPASIAESVRDHARLEQAGWKGSEGTAIREDDEQGRFYRATLERFAARGEASCFRLRFGEQIVASQLAVHRRETMVFLKTAFDEQLRSYAPGLLMQQEIIRHLYEERTIRTIEFYGRRSEATRKFSADLRPMVHRLVFRSPVIAWGYRWLKAAWRLISAGGSVVRDGSHD